MSGGETHVVANQPPPVADHDAFATDPWLRAIAQGADAGWVAPAASTLGRFVGSAEARQLALVANREPPRLATHDRYGHRIDAVEYHPAYHALMARALGAGLHSLAWTAPSSGFAARAVLFYLWNQLEQGTACPVTMTFASIPVFAHAPGLEAAWRGKVLAAAYDASTAPVARKAGATIGMAMTEKQGGSDLRMVSTLARPDGEGFRLTGHKWFCSAPMSDGFFTLARLAGDRGQDDAGVTCFFVARTLPDGTRNPFLIQRLKDKVGNRSNASAEIEYRDTFATRVGEPGRGIPTLIEMAHHTRFDIVVAVAGMMRAAFDQALHHARHRAAFGRTLADHALMQRVLADLALEAEAALLLALRLARAFDAAAGDPAEARLQRVLTPVAKYWLCRRMTPVAVEAMECLGGNGYVEESPLARLYREAPLNGIWEGSANVICLDALRALRRDEAAMDAIAGEVATAGDPQLVRATDRARALLRDEARAESRAREIVQTLALAVQAALMAREGEPAAAAAFRDARLGGPGWSMGNLGDADAGAIVRRAARDPG